MSSNNISIKPCRSDCKLLIGLRPHSIRGDTSTGTGAAFRGAKCVTESWYGTFRVLSNSSGKVEVHGGESWCDHCCWTCSFTYIFWTGCKGERITNNIPSWFVTTGKVHTNFIINCIGRLWGYLISLGASIIRICGIAARIYGNRLTIRSNYRPFAIKCYWWIDRNFIVSIAALISILATTTAPSSDIPISVIHLISTSTRVNCLWWKSIGIGSWAFIISEWLSPSRLRLCPHEACGTTTPKISCPIWSGYGFVFWYDAVHLGVVN